MGVRQHAAGPAAQGKRPHTAARCRWLGRRRQACLSLPPDVLTATTCSLRCGKPASCWSSLPPHRTPSCRPVQKNAAPALLRALCQPGLPANLHCRIITCCMTVLARLADGYPGVKVS